MSLDGGGVESPDVGGGVVESPEGAGTDGSVAANGVATAAASVDGGGVESDGEGAACAVASAGCAGG